MIYLDASGSLYLFSGENAFSIPQFGSRNVNVDTPVSGVLSFFHFVSDDLSSLLHPFRFLVRETLFRERFQRPASRIRLEKNDLMVFKKTVCLLTSGASLLYVFKNNSIHSCYIHAFQLLERSYNLKHGGSRNEPDIFEINTIYINTIFYKYKFLNRIIL